MFATAWKADVKVKPGEGHNRTDLGGEVAGWSSATAVIVMTTALMIERKDMAESQYMLPSFLGRFSTKLSIAPEARNTMVQVPWLVRTFICFCIST